MRSLRVLFALAVATSLYFGSCEPSSPVSADPELTPAESTGRDGVAFFGVTGKAGRWLSRHRGVMISGQRMSLALALVVLFLVVRCVATLRPNVKGLRRLAEDDNCFFGDSEDQPGPSSEAQGNVDSHVDNVESLVDKVESPVVNVESLVDKVATSESHWRAADQDSLIPEHPVTGEFLYRGDLVEIRESSAPDLGRRFLKLDFSFAGKGFRKIRATVDKKKKLSKLVLLEDDEEGTSVKLTRIVFSDSDSLKGKIIEEIETPESRVVLQYFVLADGREHATKTTVDKRTGATEVITDAQLEDGRFATVTEGIENSDVDEYQQKTREARDHIRSMLREAESVEAMYQEVVSICQTVDPTPLSSGPRDDGRLSASSVASSVSSEDCIAPVLEQNVELPPLELEWERIRMHRKYDSFLHSEALFIEERNTKTKQTRTKLISLRDSTISLVETRSEDGGEVLVEFQGKNMQTGETKLIHVHYDGDAAKIEKQVIGDDESGIFRSSLSCSGITGDWTTFHRTVDGDSADDDIILTRTAFDKATSNRSVSSHVVDELCLEAHGMMLEASHIRRHLRRIHSQEDAERTGASDSQFDEEEWETSHSVVVQHPHSEGNVLVTQMKRERTSELATVVQTGIDGEASIQEIVNLRTGARELVVTLSTELGGTSRLHVYIDESSHPGEKLLKRVTTRGHSTVTLKATLRSDKTRSVCCIEESDVTGARSESRIEVDAEGNVASGSGESDSRIVELYNSLQALERETALFETELATLKEQAARSETDGETEASDIAEAEEEEASGTPVSLTAVVTDKVTGEEAEVSLYVDAGILFESVSASLELASGTLVTIKKMDDGMTGETVWSRESVDSQGLKETVEIVQSLGGTRNIRKTREDGARTCTLTVNVQESGAMDVRERVFDKTSKSSKIVAAAVNATGQVKTTAVVTQDVASVLVQKADEAKALAEQVAQHAESLGQQAKEAKPQS